LSIYFSVDAKPVLPAGRKQWSGTFVEFVKVKNTTGEFLVFSSGAKFSLSSSGPLKERTGVTSVQGLEMTTPAIFLKERKGKAWPDGVVPLFP